MSRLYHPDKNPDADAAEMFIQVKLGKLLLINHICEGVAYDILSSPEKRMAYDLFQQTDFSEEESLLNALKT